MSKTIEESLSHQLPHSVEAERALLGSMILDNRQVGIALDILPGLAIQQTLNPPQSTRRGPEILHEPLFFLNAHQTIFRAIMVLYDTGAGNFDLTTLAEHLNQGGGLEQIGGAPYLAGLEDDIFSLEQVAPLASLITQKWRLRGLIRAAHGIIDDAMASDESPQEIIDRSEKKIFEIAQEQIQTDFVQIHDLVGDQLQEIEQRAKGGGDLPGLSTGLRELDDRTTGLRPANLIILAARPSMGKTALAMNIAANAALNLQRPVGIFSIEMADNELTQRLLCTQAQVSMRRVRGGKPLRRDELESLHEAGEALALAPIHIDDASSLNLLEMRSRARRLKARCPDLALIVVDYLQLMNSGMGRYENRQQEVTEISRSLKSLARELRVPVLALSQLSRQSEQRRGSKDKLPRLSDLRESGAIEQDADLVLFIHRERQLKTPIDGASEPELATLVIGKQRNGAVGKFEVLFLPEMMKFVDLAHPSRG
jgi:replicative DNA helicase